MVYARTKLSVLELGTANRNAISSILPSLPPELISSKVLDYTFSASDEEDLQKAKEIHGESSAYKVLDPKKRLESKDFDCQTFDIVILTGAPATTASQVARQLLNPTGKLCLLVEEGEDLETILESQDLALDFIEQDLGDMPGFELVVASIRPTESSDQDIFILEGDSPSAAALSDALESLHTVRGFYIPVPRRLLKSALEDLEGKSCIVTLEMGKTFLANASPEDWSIFKEIVRRCSSVVWISSLDDPTGSVVTGLARTMRNENSALIFRSLQVSSQDMVDSDRLAGIVSRLANSLCADGEFRLDGGGLKVSRIMQDPDMDGMVASMVVKDEVQIKPSTLNRTGRPLKLALPRQGLLDDIHFEIDKTADEPLGDDEVEIEVKASGIK